MSDLETGAESYLDFGWVSVLVSVSILRPHPSFAPTSFLFLLLAPVFAPVQGVKENEKQTWHGKHLTVLRNKFYCP